MKECWKEAICKFEETYQRGLSKSDFVEVWGDAYLRAFTLELVKKSFEATGILPYNPGIIQPGQMKPSEAISTHASFPLPQLELTNAVMAAF
jgi:hypothetical protein